MVKLQGIKRSLKWQHAESIMVEIQLAFMSYMSPTYGMKRASSVQKNITVILFILLKMKLHYRCMIYDNFRN